MSDSDTLLAGFCRLLSTHKLNSYKYFHLILILFKVESHSMLVLFRTWIYVHICTFLKMINNKILNVHGPKKPKREIPIILISFFIGANFLIGLDFGFRKILKKNFQFIANCFCRFSSIFIITSIFIEISFKIANAQYSSLSWFMYGFFQYTFHVIFLHFSKYNLYNLIVDIYSIDIAIISNKNKANFNLLFLFFFLFVNCTLKAVFCYLFCINQDDLCGSIYIPGYIYCILLMGIDVVTLVQILIYYHIYKAAKYLMVSLEENNIKMVRKQFTAVADVCDKISPTYGRLVSTYFIFHIFSYL